MNGIPEVQRCEDVQSASLTTLIENGKVRKIPLTQEKVAIVDAEDYERLSEYKWYAHKGANTFYAHRAIYVGRKVVTVMMHREILGFSYKDGNITDHKNRNGLDNRKINLRTTSKSLNAWNSKIRVDNSSGFRGVHWHKQRGKWQARICVNGKRISCGLFNSVDSAIAAHNKAINGGHDV